MRKFFYKYYARNLLYELQIRARASSVDYIEANMAEAMLYPNRKALFSHCMAGAPDEGMILEFGVAEGASTRQLAAMTPRPHPRLRFIRRAAGGLGGDRREAGKILHRRAASSGAVLRQPSPRLV